MPHPSTLHGVCTHAADHSRREFLRELFGFGAGALVLGQLPVRELTPSPLTLALTGEYDDRVLVMIRLKGGNDGLNTFIPVHDFGTYRAKRPDIYVPESDLIRLTGDLAMHPRLQSLEGLWQRGSMRVINGVGYPDQNLSHFRSSDIWATSSEPDEYVNSGVLGRYLQTTFPDFLTDPPATPPAIQIGGAGNLLFNNRDDFNYAVSTSDPQQLYEIARSGQLHSLDKLPECTYGDQLGYLRAVANTTFRYAGVLSDAYGRGRNDGDYQDDHLGHQLSLVARLLRGGLQTRLFVVELDGFDTHANQPEAHAGNLQSVASNVSAFFADLAAAEMDRRVLALTFSEFGRRVEQNGSQGTDHGAAAPMMLFGPALEGNGTIGAAPDLEQTDDFGNLVAGVDFRAVYATVLSRWLCIDDGIVDAVMGRSYPRMEELGIKCSATTAVSEVSTPQTDIGLRAHRDGATLVVTFAVDGPTQISIDLHDAAGRRLYTAFSGTVAGGAHERRISDKLPGGVYVVSVRTPRRVHSVRLPIF